MYLITMAVSFLYIKTFFWNEIVDIVFLYKRNQMIFYCMTKSAKKNSKVLTDYIIINYMYR